MNPRVPHWNDFLMRGEDLHVHVAHTHFTNRIEPACSFSIPGTKILGLEQELLAEHETSISDTLCLKSWPVSDTISYYTCYTVCWISLPQYMYQFQLSHDQSEHHHKLLPVLVVGLDTSWWWWWWWWWGGGGGRGGAAGYEK